MAKPKSIYFHNCIRPYGEEIGQSFFFFLTGVIGHNFFFTGVIGHSWIPLFNDLMWCIWGGIRMVG